MSELLFAVLAELAYRMVDLLLRRPRERQGTTVGEDVNDRGGLLAGADRKVHPRERSVEQVAGGPRGNGQVLQGSTGLGSRCMTPVPIRIGRVT
jgi:hypothetical protein